MIVFVNQRILWCLSKASGFTSGDDALDDRETEGVKKTHKRKHGTAKVSRLDEMLGTSTHSMALTFLSSSFDSLGTLYTRKTMYMWKTNREQRFWVLQIPYELIKRAVIKALNASMSKYAEHQKVALSRLEYLCVRACLFLLCSGPNFPSPSDEGVSPTPNIPQSAMTLKLQRKRSLRS